MGDLVFDQNGLAKSGLLVRHLVMPGHSGEARDILTWLHSLSPDTYVNVMEQYRPSHKVGTGEQRARSGFTKYEDIDKPVELSEVDKIKEFAREMGLWRLEEMELLNKPITEF